MIRSIIIIYALSSVSFWHCTMTEMKANRLNPRRCVVLQLGLEDCHMAVVSWVEKVKPKLAKEILYAGIL